MEAALFKFDGGDQQITRDKILTAIKHFDKNYRGKPNFPDQGQGWFVEFQGRTYAPKILLSLATDIPRGGFRGAQARTTLKALGFDVKRSEPDIDEEEVAEEALETTFSIESDLQKALRLNIEQLEKGMKITDGGKETVVESGRIDIKAEDSQHKAVVVELKAGKADRDAIGQVLAYMGDLSAGGNSVRGILVAGEFTPRAMAAARVVQALQLKKYGFKFSFQDIK